MRIMATTKIYFSIVFLVLYLFFMHTNSFIPFHWDDWYALEHVHTFFPSFSEWNPSRIFPEIFTYILGIVVAYIVTPVSGDYLLSYTYTVSFILSIIIILMLYIIYVISLHISKNLIFSIVCNIIIILLCFIYNKNSHPVIDYLFFANSISLCTYYTFSYIINTILILIICYEYINKNSHILNYTYFPFIIIFSYFCIFSMDTASIISASFSWCLLLQHIIYNLKYKISIYKNIKKYHVICMINILFYITSFLFNLLCPTGRYQSLINQSGENNFFKSLSQLNIIWQNLNTAVVTCVIFFIFIYIVVSYLFICKKEYDSLKNVTVIILSLLGSAVISLIVDFTADTLVPVHILQWPLYNVLFPCFLACIFSIVGLFKFFQKTKFMQTLLSLSTAFITTFFVVLAFSPESSYRYGEFINLDSFLLIKSFIQSAQEADMAGKDEFLVLTPETEWPYPHEQYVYRMEKTFYIHGLISRPMKAVIKKDPNIIQTLRMQHFSMMEH